MAKFRKTLMVVDAIRWPGQMEEDDPRADEIEQWCKDMGADPDKLIMMNDGTVAMYTFVGEMVAQPGDWIVRDINGEFYPCKPDTFAESYEPVD